MRHTQMLRTEEQKKKALDKMNELETSLKAAIVRAKELRHLYGEVGDFGCSNSFAHFAGELEQIRECDDGEAGLVPFLETIRCEIKSVREA